MKEYYCRAIRGNGEECGETRKDEFYEGRKSLCKYCEYKKKLKKEKKNRDNQTRDEKIHKLIENLCNATDKRLDKCDEAYNTIKEKYERLDNEFKELKEITNELESKNKMLSELSILYEKEINKLQNKCKDFIKKDEIEKFNKKLKQYEHR